MPSKPPTACVRPGCSGLVRNGTCSKCGSLRTKMVQRDFDERRGSSAQRGYDARWQRLRVAFMAAHPLCALCEQRGRTTAATLVDHIQPINDGGAVLDEDNLQSLCVECHAAKTKQDLNKRKQAAV